MSLFSEIEKRIEHGFRHWTERLFGPGESDELILLHRGILEEVETGVEVVSRGRRIFPHSHLIVTLIAAEAPRRDLLRAAFGGEDRLQKDIVEALESTGCEAPHNFRVDIETAAEGTGRFQIEVGPEVEATAEAAPATGGEETRRMGSEAVAAARVVVIKGKAEYEEYTLERARTNIGRMAELTDADQRVVRRNDIVFADGTDEANGTVSRAHGHIRLDGGDYRLIDDGSEFGTRVFRDGRSIDVPAGDRRGEKLRPGDEIYLGRACVRFVRS